MDNLALTTQTMTMPQQARQPKLSDNEPDTFIQTIATDIAMANQEAEEIRCREYVTMMKRQRGSAYNISDAIGIFSLDGRKWLDVPVTNIRVMNIVEPAIRANTTTQSQANVALQIEPTISTKKGAANVGNGLYEYLDTTQWTEHTEFMVCERPQVSGYVFLRSYFDHNAEENITVPEVIETEMSGSGEYACPSCGLTGEVTSDQLEDGQYACPECGEPTELDEMSESTFEPVFSFKNQKHGASKTQVISSFEIRMDTNGTAGGFFENGSYFEWHCLKTREDLEDEVPYFNLETAKMPSYTLRWQHALETGLKTIKETWGGVKEKDSDLFEVRYIYLKPKKYKKYRCPSTWSLKNKQTGEQWTMEVGETFEEAIQRQDSKAKPSKGLVFTIINDKMAAPPRFADFAEEFSMIQFAPDAFSPYGRPFTIILSIQSDVNDLNTMMMMHLEKNAISNIVVDNLVFDFEDFEKDFVPTREGQMIDDIRKHFAVVDPPRLGNEPIGYLQFLLAEANNLTGVQPAAQGQAQPGTPYHAQLLQVNQSQGLLATALKSKAQGKVNWLKNHLKLAQKYWSEEQFEKVRTQYGSEWKDEDIDDFIQCNIDNDILISFVEGSEIPKTLLQRELKLQEFIAQVSNFAQLAPGTVTPQMMNELLAQLADHSDIEFDIGNYEGDKRLAEARYERIKAGADAFNQQGMEIPTPQIDPMTGQQTDPLAQIVLRIIQQGKCTPSPQAENHNSHKEFWADRIRVIEASDDDNEILLGCCSLMWQLHDEAEVAMAQLQSMNQIKAQQPMMEFQQQQQNAQMAQQQEMQNQANQQQLEAQNAQSQQQGEAEAQKQALEQQNQQLQLADSEAQRQQADNHKQADLVNEQLQREHELKMAQMQKKESKG